jgi:hypothetical protein
MLSGQGCARSQAVRSSTAPCEIDRSWHDRSRVTAQEIHGARDEAIAARAMRGLRLTWSALDRGSYARSLVLELERWRAQS